MISVSDLDEAIQECEHEENPNANTCIKLASYYALRDRKEQSHNYSESAEKPTGTQAESKYSNVNEVFEELMETLQVLSPRLYKITLNKLKSR